MTLEEFIAANPTLTKTRPLTLNEFRARMRYRIPLEEHGALRYPHGISKAERRRIDARLKEWQAEYEASADEYEQLKAAGTLPSLTMTFCADRIAESQQTAAMYRSTWRRQEVLREQQPESETT